MNSTTAPLWCKVPKFEIPKDARIDITAYGGLAYFALFLKTTGLLDRLCSDFPVAYRSNNSCTRRDIVRNGGRRIIHLTSTHADASAIRDSLNLIGQFLGWVDSIAEQLEPDAR